MNIFLTGGAGYVGSVCAAQLIDAGHNVTVFDNLSEGHRAAVDRRAQFVLGDLRDANAVRKELAATKPDAVVHCAASALVAESMQDPAKYFQNNVVTGLNLLEAMRATGVNRIVFSSSCATYGPPACVPIPESTPQYPTSPYGESKLIFEKILHWYHCAYDLTYVGLRFFNVAGATETHGEAHRVETHLIPNVIKVALGQCDHVEIHGSDYHTPDGTCIRDYVHVSDIAGAHIAALQTNKSCFYNLGCGIGYSVADVINCCQVVTGRKIPSIAKPKRPGDPPRLIACYSRIKTALNWHPRFTDLTDIVNSAWAWHQRHPEGYKTQL